MPNPSPAAVAAIRARVSDWTPSDPSIASTLNTPSVANPTPQPTVARPYAVGDVLGVIQPGSLPKLLAVAFLPDVRDKIAANDPVGTNLYAALLYGGGVVSQAEHDAILGVINATHPDPSWSAQISWAVATLGRPVDAADIAASRPGA